MMDGTKLDFNVHSLSEGLTKNTKFFQNNIETITDPVKFLEFQKEYAALENELFHFVVNELDALRGRTPGASYLWLPQPTRGL